MELGKNIRRLRKLNNLTQQSLANQMNRSKTLIALWEKGERDPSSIDLKRLSEIFNVRADDIIGSIPSFSNTETYELNDDQVLKPILGVVKAGYNLYCEENIEGYKPVDKNKAKGAECFWLRVIGNSMNAIGIIEGALVLVKKVIVENNQIAVVRVNGDVDMAFAIAHELRHKYQIDTHVFDFDNYKTSNELSIREYNLQNEEVDANAYAYIVLMDFFKLKVDFKLLLKDDVVADAIMKRVDTIIENEYEYE